MYCVDERAFTGPPAYVHLGDGECDYEAASSFSDEPNLNCEEWDYDAGDCDPVIGGGCPIVGEWDDEYDPDEYGPYEDGSAGVYDCDEICVPSAYEDDWLDDGHCDDGSTPRDGWTDVANFDCAEFDEGDDCAGPGEACETTYSMSWLPAKETSTPRMPSGTVGIMDCSYTCIPERTHMQPG